MTRAGFDMEVGMRSTASKVSPFACAMIASAMLLRSAGGQAPERTALQASQPVVASPEQDDATLHDVQFVSARAGWAVGERGVIWKTEDAGRTWRLVKSPAACALRGVCFLTDRVGWIVGGEITPYTRHSAGVVLFTEDGGATWEVLAQKTLPYLHAVRFFGLEHGVAVGEGSAQFPSGVMSTEDGGRTWQPVQSERARGGSWRTVAFVDQQTGYVAGLRGEHAAIGGDRLLPRTAAHLGLRGVHAVELEPSRRGWLVGDGALAMTTHTSGATWEEPAEALPRELRDFMDFRAVACRGDSVWIAGTPGSVVWHSSDGGRTWTAQATRDTAPLHALHFTSDLQGCAVGAFGTILVTDDGGGTWRAARGAGRRVALLAVHAFPSRVSFNLLMRSSAEHGYRSGVALVARRDVGTDGHREADLDLRLQDAVVAAGGCEAEPSWRLPLAVPGLDHNYQRLVQEWSLLTDGRLPDVMLGGLVAQLRTWRPEVVVLDEPAGDDAVTRLLREALLQAVQQAADATRFPQQEELAGLRAWQVKRVFARVPGGSTGTIHLDPHEILPRQGKTTVMAAADAAARLTDINVTGEEREAYALVYEAAGRSSRSVPVNRTSPDNETREAGLETGALGHPPRGDLFSGLSLPAGGDARRALPAITELDYDRLEQVAQHQRNMAAYARRALDDERHAAQLIAQLKDVVGSAPQDQAARQLADLADQYRRRSQWEYMEDALIELVQRFPREPVTLEALKLLLAYWTSQEMMWQRMREVSAQKSSVSVEANVVQATAEGLQRLRQNKASPEEIRKFLDAQSSPLKIVPVGGEIKVGGVAQQRSLDAARRQEQAVRIAQTMERLSPALFASPEVQFTYASLLRQKQQHDDADAIYRRFFGETTADVWRRAAAGELWLIAPREISPRPILRCRRADVPPVLDGLLGDDCWQAAMEASLRSDSGEQPRDMEYVGTRGFAESVRGTATRTGDGEPRAIVMLAYDSKYLYVAASVPRAPELPTDSPEHAGRAHDADLTGYDQVSLQLDIDRDYATYYRFDVDSRGQTREACWIDQRWDPKWYVAADGDRRAWRIEAAIPVDELTGNRPGRGTTWGLGLVRTMPTVGVQSWTHPAGSVARPEGFGLVRFE